MKFGAVPAALAVVLASLSAPLLAQDGFDFSEDEVDTFGEGMDFTEEDWGDETWGDETGDDGWGDEGDGWGDDETVVEVEPLGPPTVTGLFVPSSTAPASVADALTASLMTDLLALEGQEAVSNESLRLEFEIMGAELAYECAFDPICLGRYGRQLGIDKIVVGRVDPGRNGGWDTTIDLIDSNSSQIENYRVFATPESTEAVSAAMSGQLRTLFGLRPIGSESGPTRSGPSPVQRAMAWTTLSLGVGAIGAGVVFGLQANSIEKELTECALLETPAGLVCAEYTQIDAQSRIDDGERAALLSNVFLGTGLFLAAGSIVLFTVTPGGDIDEDADLARAPRQLRLAPMVARGHVGVSGSLRF